MKTALKLVIGIVIVIVIAVLVVLMRIDAIAANAIEAGGTAALKVPTTVDGVNVSLLGGSVAVTGLTIANPPGFQTPHLMRFEHFSTFVEGGSIFSDTIVIPELNLDGLVVYLEQAGGSTNVKTVLNNLESDESAPAEEKPGKSYKIKHILITNTTAHVQVLPIGGQASTLEVQIDKIELNDVTPDNAKGGAMKEIMQRIIPAIFVAIGKNAGDLPGNLGQVLNVDAAKTLDELGVSADKLLGSAGGILEGVGEGGKEIGESVKEGIGNILGGQKKDE